MAIISPFTVLHNRMWGDATPDCHSFYFSFQSVAHYGCFGQYQNIEEILFFGPVDNKPMIRIFFFIILLTISLL